MQGGVREDRDPSGGYRESVRKIEDESALRAEEDIKGVAFR